MIRLFETQRNPVKRSPRLDWIQQPWVHPCFKRFLMRKCCDPLRATGPAVIGLKGWKRKDEFYKTKQQKKREQSVNETRVWLWKATNYERKVVVFESLWASVTPRPSELTAGRDESNTDEHCERLSTRCRTSSQRRIEFVSRVTSFHRWTFFFENPKENWMCRSKVSS